MRAAVLLALLGALATPASADPALDLVRRADRIRAPAEPFTVELTLITPSTTPERPAARLKVSVHDRARSLARFLEPPVDRGKTLLMVGPHLWVALPATERPLRLSPLQRLTGEVAHADVLRVNFEGDYLPRIAGEDLVNGHPCVRLDLEGTAEGVTYHRIRYWVERASARPARAEFFAVTGLLLKAAVFTRFQWAIGAERPAEVEIRDPVRGDRVTRILYANYRLEPLREEMFQPSYLRYVR
jgi:hypothetical protein